MRTAEGTPTYGSSCMFLFRATPRRDPNRTLLVRKPDARTAGRQALRERPRQDLETLRTNRNARPKSQVGTSVSCPTSFMAGRSVTSAARRRITRAVDMVAGSLAVHWGAARQPCGSVTRSYLYLCTGLERARFG